MAQIKLNVNKLGDPTVNYISLVSRGANRIPFRIVKHDKQEQGMIDLASLNLSKLFKGEKSAPVETAAQAQPTIVGFVTMKDENFDLVKKALQEAGYKISNIVEEADGSVIFKQEAEMPEHFDVIKMSDELLVLLDGADGAAAVEGTIYQSLLDDDSFLPSQELATKGMSLAMSEIGDADEPREEKVAKMELVTKDYNDYLSKLFSWVPAQLNQMAARLSKDISARASIKPEATVDELRGVISASPTAASDKDQNIGQEEGVNAKGTPSPSAFATALPKGVDPKVQGVSKADEEVVAAATVTAAPAATAAVAAPSTDEILAAVTSALTQKMESMFGNLQASLSEQIGSVTDQVNELNESVSDIKKSQEGLHDRVVESEKVAKSADALVRGKLITGDVGDDVTTQGVRKSEEPQFGGCIDTAFQSVRKNAVPAQRSRLGAAR